LFKLALPIFEKYNHPVITKLRERLNELDSITPLHLASESGDLDEIKTLIEGGADIFARSNHGTATLHRAVRGNETAIRLILEKIKEKSNQDQQQIYESINAKDTEGNTPLMWAAENGKINAAKILLEYGADFNAQNNDGETALHWAAKGGLARICATTTRETSKS
jgi:ankyrin repeat protein